MCLSNEQVDVLLIQARLAGKAWRKFSHMPKLLQKLVLNGSGKVDGINIRPILIQYTR